MKKLFRFHRSTLDEAMKTAFEFSSKQDLLNKINEKCIVEYRKISIKPYGGIDDRNGWNTYIVSCDQGVIGFTNCMVN